MQNKLWTKEMTCKQPHEIEFWTLREKNDMQKLMCCWKVKGNTKFHYYIMSHLLQKQSHFASIGMIAKATRGDTFSKLEVT
jgi:hypothetical protein